MKLLYEEELNCRRWCTRLLQLTWWFVALVTLAEAVLLAVDLHANGTANIQHELYVYLLRPSLVYIVLLGIVQLATRPLLDKKKYVQQAVLYLVAISLAVLVLAWTHYAVPVVYIMFAFPIFLSVVYAQHWLTTCTFLLNLLLFGILVLALPPLYPDGDAYLPDAMNSITTVAMLCGAFLAARLLISRQKEL
ncbi:hypothetical protein LJC04_05775, partial [Ruminococcaceae bacterium OttesenSCG-928-O06]|nr:hypothetical protein [Ruminococcaceae bacterium OttesenSCG-928-O06]